MELKRLVIVKETPDIQCHAAGTIRNLAAENQTRVSRTLAGCRWGSSPVPLPGVLVKIEKWGESYRQALPINSRSF